MADEDLRSWAASEELSEEIVDVLEQEEFTLQDLQQMSPDEVTETFQTSKLLKIKQCVSLRRAVSRLSSTSSVLSSGGAGLGLPDPTGLNFEDKLAIFDQSSTRAPSSRLKITEDQPKKKGIMGSFGDFVLGKSKGPKEEFRMILLGKTGSGKSTTGNTILGEKKFSSGAKFSSVTTDCELHITEKDGRHLEIMDCPGLYDTSKTQQEVSVTIVQAVGCTHPGPHAVVYVIRVGRYTSEDFGVYNRLKALFDDNIVNHMMLLFTGGDDLKREKSSLADVMKSAPKDLLQVVEECDHRCLVFDNTVKDKKQVEALFEQIRRIKAKNSGQPYKCPKYTQIGENIDMEVNRRLEDVYKKELEKEQVIKKLMDDIQKVQQELEASKQKLAEHEENSKREIEEQRRKAEEEAKVYRKRMKEEKSEEKKRQEELALAQMIEKQRKEQEAMVERMERQRQRELEDIHRREEERRALEERRYREQREMEERKERAHREQMERLKENLSRNEEPGILERVVDDVVNVIAKPFRWFKSLFD